MTMNLDVALAVSPPSGAAVAIGVTVAKKGMKLPAGVSPATCARRGFEGKPGQLLALPEESGTRLLVGLGDAAAITTDTLRVAAAVAARASSRETVLALALLDTLPDRLDRGAAVQAVAEGALLGAYRHDPYRAEPPARSLGTAVVVAGRSARQFDEALARARLFAEGTCLARDLANKPPVDMTPAEFALRAAEVAGREGLEIDVWDEADIERERLGGLRAVSLGSSQPARLVRLEYVPTDVKKPRTLTLVGKGITFDSGGLSIKPSDGMIRMKMDMGGAGSILGAMSVIARLAPKCRVIAYLCLSENMPGPSAIKVSDVFRARNGKTVEIHNTDAEGRLVLADGLSLASEERPDAIVDVATLTGAKMVALGSDLIGLFANDDALAARIMAAGVKSGEVMWRLPIHAGYRDQLDSEIADMKNIGKAGSAGSTIAAIFLQEFVAAGIPWAHLDIAGGEAVDADKGVNTRGATGLPTRALLELISDF